MNQLHFTIFFTYFVVLNIVIFNLNSSILLTENRKKNGSNNKFSVPMMSNEDKLFEEFKNQIQQYLDENNFLHQDHYLKKWLTARDHNVNKAVKMFCDNVEFRKRYEVDDIKETFHPNEILQNYMTGGIIGYDKSGNVLRVELFGLLDMKGLMYTCKKSDLEKMKILECEKVVQMWKESHEKDHEKLFDGMTVIFDMKDVTTKVLWRSGLEMYLHLIKLLEDNYPEMLKQLFVINAPSIFPFLWRICKPLVSEHTKKKIHILKSDYQDVLLEHIDSEVLPKQFGGTRVDEDGDERCRNIICQGGIIDKDLYNSQMVNVDHSESINIGHGAQHIIHVEIKKPNSILRWEFKSSEYDLGFGIHYKNASDFETVIIPVTRINCHLVPEDGTHLCEEIGNYELVFDNSYSVARSKKVDIYYEVLDPDESFEHEIN